MVKWFVKAVVIVPLFFVAVFAFFWGIGCMTGAFEGHIAIGLGIICLLLSAGTAVGIYHINKM